MKIVIQCASSKQPSAPSFRTSDGRRVAFVAHPRLAPPTPGVLYARPDDRNAESGTTWRAHVVAANGDAPSPAFMEAGQLYAHRAYAVLIKAFGKENVAILSAGWGLVGSKFRLPDYDITFSASAEPYKRRRDGDPFDDFRQIEAGSEDQIVFLGGKDYLQLFLATTSSVAGRRFAFFNSTTVPHAPACRLIRYPTSTRTNWHYGCALDLAARRIPIPS